MADSKSIPERSIETQLLMDILGTLKPDEIVTYETMSTAIGRDVRTVARHYLYSAIRALRHEERKAFGAVRGVGVKRLTDVGIVATGRSGIAAIHRSASRSAKTLACVAEFDKLPNAAKLDHNAALSIAGAIASITRECSVKRLTAAVDSAPKALPLGRTLEVFLGKAKEET